MIRSISTIPPTLLATVGVVVLASLVSASARGEDEKLQYNRDIRSILAENCFACHGPDSASRKASLRLDKREDAIESGAIEPGDPDVSEMIARVVADDAEQIMPPPSSKKTLLAEQKATLSRWVKEGAEYQPHWSYIAPKRSELPDVKDGDWPRNPIDRFVLANLEVKGLSPAPEADRRTLIRRLSLDLTGLPPEPADVEAFVADESPDAYEKVVDKYLASPRWGEHRARYWLDAARYADTHGIHFDNYREMWSYRDWVIKALNANMPFDQFAVEQIAGDLMPGRTLEQQIASGFNRCNITTNEGGAIDEEYKVLYTRDRTETVSQVFLGLTTGCAVCHDHKFDPISQKEFYELAAFFNNTTQAAMDGNIPDTPPTVFVPPDPDRERWDALVAENAGLKQGLASRKQAVRPEFDSFFVGSSPDALAAKIPDNGLKLRVLLGDGDMPSPGSNEPGGLLTVADAGDFDTNQAFSYGAFVRIPKADAVGSVVARMSGPGWDLWVQNGVVGAHLVNTWPTDAFKVLTKTAVLQPNELTHLFVTYDGSGKADGVKIYVDGHIMDTTASTNTLKPTSSIRTKAPLTVARRASGNKIDDAVVRDLRLYDRALPANEVEAIAGAGRGVYLAVKPVESRVPAELDKVFAWWLNALDTPSMELRGKLASVEGEQATIKARGTIALVMQERSEEANAFILNRGEYDKRGEEVKASTPAILPPMPEDLPENRLGLARWLVRPEHPLTARVTVNRFWQQIFGDGLVRTAGDFGVSGELPSNPELLDWMALEFRDNGWDMKAFMKLLVTSATYRQSSAITPEKLEKDPLNLAISRGPRFRMDAEMVRDYALAASGLLVDKIGGPSVKPYQPSGVWEAVAMPESNTRNYKRDSGDKLYRRSLYTFWKRAAPPASMDTFNAPSREVCMVRRERTDTPLQALVTLNDPQFVEAAKVLAQGAMKDSSNDEGRFALIFERLVARPIRAEEASVVAASLADLRSFYQDHPDDARRLLEVGEAPVDSALDPSVLAAWTMLCNELMNLDEVLNK